MSRTLDAYESVLQSLMAAMDAEGDQTSPELKQFSALCDEQVCKFAGPVQYLKNIMPSKSQREDRLVLQNSNTMHPS